MVYINAFTTSQGVVTLNRDQERFGNVQMNDGASRRHYALCFSSRCTRNNTGVEKKARRGTSKCPDCSHAIVWKMEYV